MSRGSQARPRNVVTSKAGVVRCQKLNELSNFERGLENPVAENGALCLIRRLNRDKIAAP